MNDTKPAYRDYITSDPQVCHGEPVIRGTRVFLRTILASLAVGDTIAEIRDSFPSLSEEDVWAAIAFAADSTAEDLPHTGLPWLDEDET